MAINDQEPRYRLLDSSGTVIASFYLDDSDGFNIQEATNNNEITLASDGTVGVPALDADDISGNFAGKIRSIRAGTQNSYPLTEQGLIDALNRGGGQTIIIGDDLQVDPANLPTIPGSTKIMGPGGGRSAPRLYASATTSSNLLELQAGGCEFESIQLDGNGNVARTVEEVHGAVGSYQNKYEKVYFKGGTDWQYYADFAGDNEFYSCQFNNDIAGSKSLYVNSGGQKEFHACIATGPVDLNGQDVGWTGGFIRGIEVSSGLQTLELRKPYVYTNDVGAHADSLIWTTTGGIDELHCTGGRFAIETDGLTAFQGEAQYNWTFENTIFDPSSAVTTGYTIENLSSVLADSAVLEFRGCDFSEGSITVTPSANSPPNVVHKIKNCHGFNPHGDYNHSQFAFAIDSPGEKTATLNWDVAYPTDAAVVLHADANVANQDASDWVGWPFIKETTNTGVTVGLYVQSASATGGATAQVAYGPDLG